MVVFNALDEFLKELATDKDSVERKIVRLTYLYQQSTISPFIRHLSVVASYKAAGEIVEFRQYVGDLWKSSEDKKVLEQSGEIQRHIEVEVKRLGLEVRAGLYKEGGAP